MPLPRTWDDHRLPRAAARTLYRPVTAPHPAIPRGQLARARTGAWYYRPDDHEDRTGPALPRLLHPGLEHALVRRGQLLTAAETEEDPRVRQRLTAAFTILGTRDILDLEDALHHACDVWHQQDLPDGAWTLAPPDLTQLAERLRPAGTHWGHL